MLSLHFFSNILTRYTINVGYILSMVITIKGFERRDKQMSAKADKYYDMKSLHIRAAQYISLEG